MRRGQAPLLPRCYCKHPQGASFLGEETVAQVIFGPAGAEPILGVVALENTGMVVDPISNNLKRLHAKPLK